MDNKQKGYKINTLNLVKHHKTYCKSDDCGVSLWQLKVMAEEVGCEFTKKEVLMFN